jgi:hypothetical protein
MDQWDDYFPPLNLWNYSLHWQWIDTDSENPSDGPAMVSTGVDSRDGNTVGDDRKSSEIYKCKR